MTAKPNTPEQDVVIVDEEPRGAYDQKVVCKYVVGPKGKQCKAVRYVKKQDLFQCKYCTHHSKAAANDRSRARAKAKRDAAKAKPTTKKAAPKKATVKKAPKLKVVKTTPSSTPYDRAVAAVAA
jgi:hypothetical protein